MHFSYPSCPREKPLREGLQKPLRGRPHRQTLSCVLPLRVTPMAVLVCP